MIYEFKNIKPVIDPSAYVHPQAVVIGNVTIGADVYIGPFATLRGDWGEIIIEKGCNVQESCTLHLFPNGKVWLKENAHIGHGAIIHGATIGENTLIGMNTVVLDNVEIEADCIIGALSLVKANEKIPTRNLWAGNPAKYIKTVSDDMLAWKTEGTKIYQQLPKDCMETMKPCEPLREPPKDKISQIEVDYQPWKK